MSTEVVELSARKQRKHKFREKLEGLLEQFKKIMVLNIDSVGSNQMQQVRMVLRGECELLMGKNTIIRKVLTDYCAKIPELENLIPFVKGNVGLAFTNGDLNDIKEKIVKNKVPAAAKSGAFAPVNVSIPAGPTGLDPGQTNFFQSMNIATKISRGAIEIINEVRLINAGERVSASATSLLAKLNIKPFFFGIGVLTVYDEGFAYDACVLDWTDADLLAKFYGGVSVCAALSLALNYPTQASLPHILVNGFKNLLALSVATDYTFEESKQAKAFLENPDAFKSAAPAGGAAAAAKAPEPEPEEEEEEDMDFDLFG